MAEPGGEGAEESPRASRPWALGLVSCSPGQQLEEEGETVGSLGQNLSGGMESEWGGFGGGRSGGSSSSRGDGGLDGGRWKSYQRENQTQLSRDRQKEGERDRGTDR